jgi:hypothetical protein
LFLEREDDLVGHKRLIYAIDKSDKTRDATRKVVIDFFKSKLGFTQDDIIFVDRNEFNGSSMENMSTKFSAETI